MPDDYRTLQDALIAGTLGIAQHGEAVVQEPSGDLGYIDDDGAWCPRRLRRRPSVHGPLFYRVPDDVVRAATAAMAREHPLVPGSYTEIDASHLGLNIAVGEDLERIGRERGLDRNWVDDESDAEFRERLLRSCPSQRTAWDEQYDAVCINGHPLSSIGAVRRQPLRWVTVHLTPQDQDDRHPMEDVDGGD